MKQIYLSLLLIATALSCETSDIKNSNGNILFDVDLTQSQTKGTMAETEEQISSIAIYCAHTQNAYWSESTTFDKMANERLDYDDSSGTWVYEKTAPLWENSSTTDRYTFLAYSPYATSDNNIEPSLIDGALSIQYTTPTECANQPDLMLSIPQKDIYPPIGGTVSLQFKHALSAIGFNVKGLTGEKVSSIKVKGVIESGKVKISDSGEISWSDFSLRGSNEYSAIIDQNVIINTATPQTITSENGYLMMIPQSTNGVEVEVSISDSESKEIKTQTFSLSDEQSWEAGECYTYTLNLSSYDYTIEGSANSYMIQPTGEEQTVYIPVEGRINVFWRDYADDSAACEDMLSSSDEWSAVILWHDLEGGISGVTAERATSGFSPSETVTPNSAPDFTTIGSQSVMKITLPATITEGNILLAVEKDGVILWSWHLWITEYDPYQIAQRSTSEVGRYVYSRRNLEGEIHRYDDFNLWLNLYKERFMMDRNLGARSTDYTADGRGALHYQYGRKDPFPVNCSIDIDILYNMRPTYAEAVQTPTTFYTQSNRPFSWSEEGYSGTDQYLWGDKNVENDPNTAGKSFFDPSPLGWKVPRLGTYAILAEKECDLTYKDNTMIYNSEIKFPMTGYRSNYNGSVRYYGSEGKLRLSTTIDNSTAYNLSFDESTSEIANNTRADGFAVRCVLE